jgi:lipoprotein-anchoring transpeptidase ErfK/SrfK
MAFVQAGLDAPLPANPRLMRWRYFATISDRDRLFAVHGPNAADALLIRGHFMVSNLAMA